MATLNQESRMPKGYEDFKSGKKKAKLTLKEKRQRKRDKKMHVHESMPHTDIII